MTLPTLHTAAPPLLRSPVSQQTNNNHNRWWQHFFPKWTHVSPSKLQRKRGNRHEHPRSVLTGLVLTVGLSLLLGGCAWVMMMIPVRGRRAIFGQEYRQSTGFQNFPHDLPDLWPSSESEPPLKSYRGYYQTLLHDCLPWENADCQQSNEDVIENNNIVHILSSPGVLGRVFDDFLHTFIDMSQTDETENAVVLRKLRFSELPKSGRPITIVRLVILPLLLEAVDLALEATGPDFEADKITREDLIAVARQITRWHCRTLGIQSDNTELVATINGPLLSMSFDRLMAYPFKAQSQLVRFLGLHHDEQNSIEVDMEGKTEQVFHRIDDCTLVFRKLPNGKEVEETIHVVVQEEINGGNCASDPLLPMHGADTRVTNFVGNILSGTSDLACSKYPQAHHCNNSHQ